MNFFPFSKCWNFEGVDFPGPMINVLLTTSAWFTGIIIWLSYMWLYNDALLSVTRLVSRTHLGEGSFSIWVRAACAETEPAGALFQGQTMEKRNLVHKSTSPGGCEGVIKARLLKVGLMRGRHRYSFSGKRQGSPWTRGATPFSAFCGLVFPVIAAGGCHLQVNVLKWAYSEAQVTRGQDGDSTKLQLDFVFLCGFLLLRFGPADEGSAVSSHSREGPGYRATTSATGSESVPLMSLLKY